VYTYYKQVSYRVLFESNGGSNVTSQYVTNGKTASKPADPTYEGHVFLGWYSDSAYTTAFDFEGTQITAATTLYARWAEKAEDAEEFEIKFDLNYEGAESMSSMTTIGGKLYDVVTPTRDGYTFRGWWVSAAPDGEEVELSRQYTSDMTFDANLTLYADWEANATGSKLSKPIVTVTESSISWTNVKASKYSYEIVSEDGEVVRFDETGSTSVDYDFTALAGGKYKVSVTAVAANAANNSDEAVVYYVHKALTKVSKFTVVDGALIFNGVENAERYLITVNCGDPSHNHTDFDNGKSTYYNFSNCPMQKGGIKFTVKAVADGYATSVSDTFVYNKELAAVTELAYDSETQSVGWKSVDFAASYVLTVKVDGETVVDGVDVGNVTSYSLKYYTGAIEVSVYAKTKGYNSADATTTTFTKEGLTAPINVVVANKAVTWTAVEGATSYVVTVAGTEYTADSNRFDLTTVLAGLSTGNYSVTVKAVSAAAESMASDAVTFNNNGLEGTVKYRDGKVSWQSVIAASRYEVRVNGSAKTSSYASDVSSATVTFTKAGDNSVEVRYYDGAYWSDWVGVTVKAYAIEFDSCGGTAVSTIYKAVGDEITMPEAPTYTGYDFAGWYTARGGAESNASQFNESTMTEAGNKMLFASWTAKTYTITLVAGEGNTVATETINVKFGESFTLPVPTAGNAEEVFGGWYNEEDGKTGVVGVQYTNEVGESVRNWDFADNTTLYAHYNSLLKFEYSAVDDAYWVTKNSAVSSKYFTGTLTIPAEYNGKPVTLVNSSAFASLYYLEKIRLPECITHIAENAFTSCSKLTDIEIYEVEGVKEPAYSANNGILIYNDNETGEKELFFVPAGKTGVLELPEGITYIATQKIKSLKVSKIIIPTTVTRIEEKAIYSCSSLKDVEFKAGGTDELTVVSMGDTATGIIYSCSAMESVVLPARLKTFSADMLINCTSLLSISYEDSSASNYKTVDGILYSQDETEVVYCPRGREGAITFSDKVTKIGKQAFYKCTKLTEITFGGMLQEIGESAFEDCYVGTYSTPTGGIKKITFAKGTTSGIELKIGARAFYRCYNLSEVVYSEGSNVTEIGELAFYYCSSIKEIYIPATVKTIGANAFSKMYAEKITFAENSSLETIGEGAFANIYITSSGITYYASTYYTCTTITLPASLKKIGEKAFYGLTTLTSVYFEESTTELEICDNAFYGCKGLTTFNVPSNVVKIGDGVFGGCTKLTEITVNGNATSAEADSKYYTAAGGVLFSADMTELLCYPAAKVGSYTIPDTVKKIGANLFANNTAITSLTIGKNVTYIGEGAFYKCTALEEVIFEEGDENAEALTLNGGKDSASGIFSYCQKLKRVVLSNRVTNIPAYMFYYDDAITEFVMSSAVTDIARYAFYYCTAMTGTLTLPNTVTSIGSYAFYNTGFTQVVFANGGTEKLNIVDIWDAKTGELLTEPVAATYVFANMKNLTSITLPERLTAIADKMFYYDSALTSITVPSTVERIGNTPFYGCSALSSINFTDSDDDTSTLTIDKSYTYGDYSTVTCSTFYGCTALTSVTLPKRLSRVSDYLFKDMSALTSVKIPATITNGGNGEYAIGYNAFYGCKNLASVEFYGTPKGTETLTISSYAFYNCVKLTELSLPSTLGNGVDADGNATTVFGKYSSYYNPFINCTSLEKITVAPSDKDTDYYYTDDQGLLYYKWTDDDGNTQVSLEMCPVGKTGKVIVPKEVTLVGTRLDCTTGGTSNVTSFLYCKNITEIEFEEGGTADLVIDGGYYSYNATNASPLSVATAFTGCNSLTKVSLPSRLTKIGNGAFAKLTKLTTVTFGENCKLTEIGDRAFYGSGITDINIPAATTKLGDAMFYGSSLTSITLNSAVDELSSLLSGCDYIETVTVNSTEITSENGVFYTNVKDEDTGDVLGRKLIYYPMGKTDASFEVPADVIEIASYAFQGTTKLKSITFAERTKELTIGEYAFIESGISAIVLPAQLKSLGAGAFIRNTALKSVTFAEGSVITAIAAGTFWGCSNLESIELPESVTSVGAGAFGLCDSMETVTFKGINALVLADGATTSTNDASKDPVAKEYGVFQYCSSLKSVDFNGRSMEIPAYTFCYDEKLESVNVKATSVGNYAFRNCAELETIDLTTYTDTSIGSYAFAYCTKLNNITVPACVTTIGANAFAYCTSLTTINNDLSAVTALGASAFADCTNLEMEIDISNVTGSATAGTLGDSAFANTKVYGDITINASIKTIAKGVFANTNITSVTLAGTQKLTISAGSLSSSTGVCTGAFSGTKITAIDFTPRKTVSIGAYTFYNCNELTEVALTDNVTTHGNYMFAECDKLASVEISTSAVTATKQGTFMNCHALTSVTFTGTGTKLATIAANTFEGIGAADIEIPGCVKTISNKAFLNSQIKSLSFEASRYAAAEKNNLRITYATKAEYGAFSGCTNLTSIDLSGRELFIGAYAFAGCTAVTSVDLCSTVSARKAATSGGYGYEANVFYGCTALRELKICTTMDADTVTSVPADAFAGLTSLKTLTFYAEDGKTEILKSIGNNAFEGTGITAVEIPASVTTIGAYTFNNCAELASVTFAVNDSGKSNLVWLCSGYGFYADKYANTFGNCPKLTSITLPETTGDLHVGDKAFANSGLVSVTLSSTVDIVGCGAFEGCKDLTTVNLGSGVKDIYSYAFKDCTSLASIDLPTQLESLGAYAFSGCTAMTTIQIPQKTEVGVCAFYGCTKLTTIDYSLKEGYAWEDNALYESVLNGDGTTTKILVSVLADASGTFMVSSTVTKIAKGAFAGTNIEAVEISGTNVEIESYAFANMKNLKSVTLTEGTTEIGDYAFYGCENLTSITIPSTVVRIGNGAFAGTGITSIVIPKAVKSIGDYAFNGCEKLADVTFEEGVELTGYNKKVDENTTTYAGFGVQVFTGSGITAIALPKGVTVMDDYMFSGCTALTTLSFADKITSIGTYVLDGTQVADFTIDNTVTDIDRAAFVGSSLVNVVFEDNDDTTDGSVIKWFGGTTSLNNKGDNYLAKSPFANVTTLKTVTLARMSSMPSYMFYGCTSLDTVVFKDSVTDTYIPYYAFYGAPVTSLTFSKATTNIYDYAFYGNKLTELTIPSTVTALQAYAFYGAQITTLTIPNTLNTLNGGAFGDCDKLTTLIFEEGGSDITIGAGSGSITECTKHGAFEGCIALKNVTLAERVTTLGTRMFAYTGIESIEIPETTTSLGTYTFLGSQLSQINIPEALTSLSTALFANTQFTSFEIPNTVTSCGTYLFYGCEKLASVKLSSSVTFMNSYQFQDCTALKSITIPKSYTYINASALEGCTALESITFEGSAIKLYKRAFAGCSAIRTLNMPQVVTFLSSAVEVFDGWTSAQTIVFPGYMKASNSWPDGWDKGCEATIKYAE